MTRQSSPPPHDRSELNGDVMRARARVASTIKKRLGELGVADEKKMPGWLEDRIGVRWQTAQRWVLGEVFPGGRNLVRLAEALDMTPADLLGPLRDDLEPPPPEWLAFQGTPEGKSMSEDERWALRLFSWPRDPNVSDYRSLLALLRANAERT